MKEFSLYDAESRGRYLSVDCYYRKVYQDFSMAIHTHPRIEIMYVVYGEMLVEYYENGSEEKRAVTLLSHDYVIIDMNVPHTIVVFGTATQIINIELGLVPPKQPLSLCLQSLIETDENVARFFRSRDPVVKLFDQGGVERLLTLLQDELNASGGDGPGAFIYFGLAALVALVAGNFCRQKHSLGDARIKYVRYATQYIETHFQNPLTGTEIAAYAGVCQNYLNNLFRNEFGLTVNQYCNRYRIMKARILIETSALPLSRIAREVGYCSKQNFNKNFLRFAGTTPRAYKKQALTKDKTHWSAGSDAQTFVIADERT